MLLPDLLYSNIVSCLSCQYHLPISGSHIVFSCLVFVSFNLNSSSKAFFVFDELDTFEEYRPVIL